MITSEEIKKLSELARVELSAGEKKSLKKDLEQVLVYMNKLKEVNVRGMGELTHAIDVVNVSRADAEVEPAAKYTAPLLKAMKAVKNGFLKVKYIFQA